MIFFPGPGAGERRGAAFGPVFAAVLLLLLPSTGCAAKKPVVGKIAPDFSLSGLTSEETVTLSKLRGKVVLVDFWASWCLPCRQFMPRIAELKATFPELEVVAVSVDANRDKAITFLRAVEPSLRAVHDVKHKAANAYGVERMPTSYLIDRSGKLRFRHEGYTAGDFKAMEREIRLLLEE